MPSDPGSPSDRDSERTRQLGRAASARDDALTASPQVSDEQDPSRVCALQPVPDMADPRSTDDMSALHGLGATADVGTGAGRGRGRDPRGKVLSASETVEERAAAQAQADMDKEKAAALEGLAALALSHKEREFEHAHNIVADRERNKVLKQVSTFWPDSCTMTSWHTDMNVAQKQRAHHKLRDKPLIEELPSESERTMVDQLDSVLKIPT